MILMAYMWYCVRTYTTIFFNMQVFFIFLVIIFAVYLSCN